MKTKKMTRSQFLGTTIGIPLITLSGSNKGFFLKSEHASFQANEKIVSDREAGLKYLKPSKKDLEHGLELHRNSLVMETYGFMPRASPDGDAFASKMKENASPVELQVKSMAWTNWPLFTVGMVQMGYSDENIQKILGGNAIRVAKAALT